MAQNFNDLMELIDSAVSAFQKKVPGLQNQLYNELQAQLQQLKTSNGKILASTENLKLIISIKKKLERIVLNKDYKKQVGNLLEAFNGITDFHNNYFSKFNKKFTPGKTLQIIKELSIEATVNSLTEAGISANVMDPINKILRTNITTGGSVAELQQQLRENIMTQGTEGSLERYTKQITTDALNQYSAQYNKAVADDLKLEWFMYVGSNLTTTRKWCKAMTAKKYVHISELAGCVAGTVDGEEIPLNKKTKLPEGMIPGTTAANVTVYRGGYNCGHQLIAVDELAVPMNVKNKTYATPVYQLWKLANKKAA